MSIQTYRFGRNAWVLWFVGLVLLGVSVSCTMLQQGQNVIESVNTDDKLFHWHREGGFAGFCDDVTIVSITVANVSSCKASPPAFFADVQLTADEQVMLTEWLATYSTDTYEQSDPATADSMLIAMQFYGSGSTTPDEAAWQLMDRFAQDIYARARR